MKPEWRRPENMDSDMFNEYSEWYMRVYLDIGVGPRAWGIFTVDQNSHISEGGRFSWFDSLDELLDVVAEIGYDAFGAMTTPDEPDFYEDRAAQTNELRPICDAIRHGEISLEDAPARLYEASYGIFAVEWLGQYSSLLKGGGYFAQEIIQLFLEIEDDEPVDEAAPSATDGPVDEPVILWGVDLDKERGLARERRWVERRRQAMANSNYTVPPEREEEFAQFLGEYRRDS